VIETLGERYASCPSDSLWIGTFHSLALRIIRPHYNLINRTSNFSIIDADDQNRIVKKIMKEANIDDKKYLPKAVVFHINKWKNSLFDSEKAIKTAKRFSVEEVAAKIFETYETYLYSMDVIDFGDILKYCVNIFEKHIEILETYQQRFRYIMVDEYQDTNTVQYVWLKLLSMQHGNICCVGDDDQSIYSWRGADIENILKFEKDFKEAKIIKLEQNYRSTENILKTANSIISNNQSRMAKNLWTEAEKGSPVVVKGLMNPIDEAIFVSNLILNKNSFGTRFDEMAILVRSTFQTRAFEDRLLSMGIPYRIIGGLKFYERKEIKDAVAYLKLVVNEDDGASFERVINTPKRGIGATTINKFFQKAKEEKISIPRAAKIIASESGSSSILSFFEKIDRWRHKVQDLSPSEFMKEILEESGYLEMLRSRKSVEDEGRIESLKELVLAMKSFESIVEFLDYISLVLDNIESSAEDKVVISTIHASKGLEYHTVFVPGFEENIIPHQKAIEEKGDQGLEEERRLCYVAITRARKEAYITFCNSRGSYYSKESWQRTYPSRFLRNFPCSNAKII
jgi:DNA helicase-2/ATP-dependent DNA helicase PcrA